MKVCLSTAYALFNPQGGHLWIFLNWALGLQANDCEVVWLDAIAPDTSPAAVDAMLARLQSRIAPYGFAGSIAFTSLSEQPLPDELSPFGLSPDTALEADLLINFQYNLPASTVSRFKRSAVVDIDPGVLQLAAERGFTRLAPHDVYFTISETLGTRAARFTDAGLRWHYTPPCVSLEHWPTSTSLPDAPFTTVSHWSDDDWLMIDEDGSYYKTDKRAGFQPFLGIAKLAPVPFELALNLDGDSAEQAAIEAAGWRVRRADEVALTPADFQRYVQSSRGEFSCCKPHCVKLQNGWLSDRTVCYLASGKPAVVQDTGPTEFLPADAGLFRFRDMGEAVRSLETVAGDYERQCRLARALAEEYFDAKTVTRRLLERALD